MTARHFLSGRAEALADTTTDDAGFVLDDSRLDYDGDQYDREERAALRRVAGLSTELEDITEVEYRQLRLERVVLVGVWTEGTVDDAENSMAELAAARRDRRLGGARRRSTSAGRTPDPATYIGRGKVDGLARDRAGHRRRHRHLRRRARAQPAAQPRGQASRSRSSTGPR